jgi:hypothetical protein
MASYYLPGLSSSNCYSLEPSQKKLFMTWLESQKPTKSMSNTARPGMRRSFLQVHENDILAI